MTREAIIDKKILDIETSVRKIQVMIGDLFESYFCEEVISEVDTWKILSHYYDDAGVKVCIIGDLVLNLCKSLEELKNAVNITGEAEDTHVQFPEGKQGDLK